MAEVAGTGDGLIGSSELLEAAAGLVGDAGERDRIVTAIGFGVEFVVDNGRGVGVADAV